MTPDDIRHRAEYPGLKAMLPSQECEMLLALADVYEAVQPGRVGHVHQSSEDCDYCLALARVEALKP